MTIHDYFGEWLKVIDLPELYNVMNILNKEYSTKPICPKQEDVFRAFKLCPYKELKAVMLGQDPYPQKNVATGILFGNKIDISEESLSPSLKIIKEAVINFEIPHNCVNFDNSLESWCSQGILMLNSALTVEMNKVGSHTMLWRKFMASLLKNISDSNSGILYVLFGNQAQTFKPYINPITSNILEVKHPAYYARTKTKMPYSIFTTISKEIYRLSDYKIKWFNELNI